MVPMDWFSFLIAGVGVYVSVAVLVLGLAWRVWQWSRRPKAGVKLGMYPKPATGAGRFGKMLKDTFVFPQVLEVDKKIWFFAMLFHLGIAAAFVGHLRLFTEFTFLVDILGEEGMETAGGWAGSIAGTILLIAVLYYIARRTFGHFKDLSVPEDFFLLFILLGIFVLGDHMRFFGHVESSIYREYWHSILAFAPAWPEGLAYTGTRWVFVGHMFFVDLLFLYFPFSKLVHTIGSFSTNLWRSE